MKSPKLAFIELERQDWSRYRDIRAFISEPIISSDYIPEALIGLFSAQTAEEIREKYWQIENHAVVQGNTFEVAEHLIPVLIASLSDLEGSDIRASILELIFQMVAYFPHSEEIDIGNTELTERCRMRAREGLWDLYRILVHGEAGESELARLILEVIDTEPERLAAFVSARAKTRATAES